jgi:transcriptional regulator with XRE-family HTH domain
MSQDLNLENAEKIKSARLRLGLTQLGFAAMIKMDRAYLSELENGRQKIQEWVLDKVEKIEREHVENYNIAHAPLPGRPAAPGPSDLPLILEAIAAGLDARELMSAVQRITADTRVSDGAKALCAELLGSKARTAPAAKLPLHIQGLNSELSAAQRADATRQQALARRASQGPSPSPKAGAPNAGKAPPARGTAGRRTSRRSARGPAPA